MIPAARYAHTNLIARDWTRLAEFYRRVFGCQVIPPERDLSDPSLAAATGVPGAALRGVHLRLPGHGVDGPTLEIFTYAALAPAPPPAVIRPGFGHIAFAVPSVEDARAEVIEAGGQAVGDVVTTTIADGRQMTWCYVTDPEGNVIELQRSGG
jgi:catechol 2,3-dioxygenase-like lactoylglutathione lyase family enzyme